MQFSSVSMFDHWAPGYDHSALQPAFSRAHRAVLDAAAGRPAPPRGILDVGCGTGRLLAEAGTAFPEADLLGVDPSAGMLAVAAARSPGRCRLVRARAEHLPFPDGTFDLVTATYSFRHWSDPAVALRQIARVLAPRGLLGLVDVFPGHRGRARGWRHPFGAGRPLPPGLARTLRSAGLRSTGVTVLSGDGAVTDMTVVLAAHGCDGPAPTAGAVTRNNPAAPRTGDQDRAGGGKL